jgi:hypothetical protein
MLPLGLLLKSLMLLPKLLPVLIGQEKITGSNLGAACTRKLSVWPNGVDAYILKGKFLCRGP